jgi:RimJ/RimL family protein N-acetyltransferase
MRDFDPLAEFFADPERAWGFGGAETRPDAWRWFASNIGHWHIHGYGYFTIEMTDGARPAGLCGIWNPEGWPEPELGWLVFAPFEGRGIAYEAALRARAWRYERTYRNVTLGEDMLYRHPGPAELDADGGVEAYA